MILVHALLHDHEVEIVVLCHSRGYGCLVTLFPDPDHGLPASLGPGPSDVRTALHSGSIMEEYCCPLLTGFLHVFRVLLPKLFPHLLLILLHRTDEGNLCVVSHAVEDLPHICGVVMHTEFLLYDLCNPLVSPEICGISVSQGTGTDDDHVPLLLFRQKFRFSVLLFPVPEPDALLQP